MKLRLLIIAVLCGGMASSQSVDEAIQLAIDRDHGNLATESTARSIEERSTYESRLPDPMIQAGVFALTPETRVGPQLFSVQVSQSMPWFGTLTSIEDWKRSMAEVTRSDKQIKSNMIAEGIAQLYYELYMVRSTMELLEGSRTIFEAVERISTEKTKVGKAGVADVLRVQMEKDEIDRQIDQLKVREGTLVRLLNIHTGRESEATWELPDTLEAPGIEGEVLPDSTNAMLRKLSNKERMLMEKQAFTEKKGAPMMMFGLNYVNVGERTDMNPSDNGKDILMPMVGLSIPLGAKSYAAFERSAEMEIEANRHMYQEIQEDLKAMWEQLMGKYNREEVNLETTQQLRKKAITARDILLQQYAVDGKDIEDILKVERMVIKYDMELIRSVATMWQTVYAIKAKIRSEYE